MPHVVVEYSANLEADIAPRQLVEAVHGAVLAFPAFEKPGVRTRAARREHFLVAEGDPEDAFIAVTIRIGPGRDVATRKAASDAVMDALVAATGAIYQRRGLALSVEVTELDDAGMTRRSNLRDRMRARASGGEP